MIRISRPLRAQSPLRTCLAVAALAALTAHTWGARPAAAKTTAQEDVVAATLLSGWQTDKGTHMAGLRLDLAPGWKTYWRSPGDAGIPPAFDWSRSTNLKAVHLHWPSPTVFHTNGYQTIGYVGGLLLPIEVVAEDPTAPVTLDAVMELGVCDKICIPATLHLTGRIDPPGAPDPEIRAALRAMPVPGTAAGVSAVSCTVEPIADGLRITATIALPALPGPETVAFETADPRVWVSESTTRRSGGTLIAATEMVGPSGAPFALDRSGLTLTVIHDQGAVEISGCPAP